MLASARKEFSRVTITTCVGRKAQDFFKRRRARFQLGDHYCASCGWVGYERRLSEIGKIAVS